MSSNSLADFKPIPAPPLPHKKEITDADLDQEMAKHRGKPKEVAGLINQSSGANRGRLIASAMRVLSDGDKKELQKELGQGGGGGKPQPKAPTIAAAGKPGAKPGAKPVAHGASRGPDHKAGHAGGGGTGSAAAGGGAAIGTGGDPVAEATNVAATFTPADRKLVEAELAEHQAWGRQPAGRARPPGGNEPPSAPVPESGKAPETAGREAGSALTSFGGAALQGAGMTLAIKGAEKGLMLLATKIPNAGPLAKAVPAVGLIVGGVMAAKDIGGRVGKVGADGSAIAADWKGGQPLKLVADCFELLSDVCGVVADVANIIAGICGVIMAASFILWIIGVGEVISAADLPLLSVAMDVSSLASAFQTTFSALAALFRVIDMAYHHSDPAILAEEGKALDSDLETVGGAMGSAAADHGVEEMSKPGPAATAAKPTTSSTPAAVPDVTPAAPVSTDAALADPVPTDTKPTARASESPGGSTTEAPSSTPSVDPAGVAPEGSPAAADANSNNTPDAPPAQEDPNDPNSKNATPDETAKSKALRVLKAAAAGLLEPFATVKDTVAGERTKLKQLGDDIAAAGKKENWENFTKQCAAVKEALTRSSNLTDDVASITDRWRSIKGGDLPPDAAVAKEQTDEAIKELKKETPKLEDEIKKLTGELNTLEPEVKRLNEEAARAAAEEKTVEEKLTSAKEEAEKAHKEAEEAKEHADRIEQAKKAAEEQAKAAKAAAEESKRAATEEAAKVEQAKKAAVAAREQATAAEESAKAAEAKADHELAVAKEARARAEGEVGKAQSLDGESNQDAAKAKADADAKQAEEDRAKAEAAKKQAQKERSRAAADREKADQDGVKTEGDKKGADAKDHEAQVTEAAARRAEDTEHALDARHKELESQSRQKETEAATKDQEIAKLESDLQTARREAEAKADEAKEKQVEQTKLEEEKRAKTTDKDKNAAALAEKERLSKNLRATAFAYTRIEKALDKAVEKLKIFDRLKEKLGLPTHEEPPADGGTTEAPVVVARAPLPPLPALPSAPSSPPELDAIAARFLSLAQERVQLRAITKHASHAGGRSQQAAARLAMIEATLKVKDGQVDSQRTGLAGNQTSLGSATAHHGSAQGQIGATAGKAGPVVGAAVKATNVAAGAFHVLGKVIDVSGTEAHINAFRDNLVKTRTGLTEQSSEGAQRNQAFGKTGQRIVAAQAANTKTKASVGANTAKATVLKTQNQAGGSQARQIAQKAIADEQKAAAQQSSLEGQYKSKRAALVTWASAEKAQRVSILAARRKG